MIEKIKNLGWTALGIAFFVIFIFAFAFLVRAGVSVTERYMDLINTINGWVLALILLLLVLSVIPRLRLYTGLLIYNATLIWGVLFWLFCLFVTYQFWGVFGVFIGLIMAGIGIFATATLAILFSGQFSAGFVMILNILFIFGVRILGQWIASKHKDGSTEVRDAEVLSEQDDKLHTADEADI